MMSTREAGGGPVLGKRCRGGKEVHQTTCWTKLELANRSQKSWTVSDCFSFASPHSKKHRLVCGLFPLFQKRGRSTAGQAFLETLLTRWTMWIPLFSHSMQLLSVIWCSQFCHWVGLKSEEDSHQGCIICSILPSGMGASGVSSEHVENMEMFSCSPT